jgi:hypothetical protein
MQKEIRALLDSLPKTEASFVEPMECLSVSKLPEDSRWVWEILCGCFCGVCGYVALVYDLAREAHGWSPSAT